MYPIREPQNPSFGDRSASFLDTLLDSPVLFIFSIAIAVFLVCVALAFIASLFDETDTPYKDLSEKSLAERVAIATSLLSACLPAQFTRRENPAQVIYKIDPWGYCLVDLRTARGAQITLPGELLSIVCQVISPQVDKAACAVFVDKDVVPIRYHLAEHAHSPDSLDALDARFEPLACEGSALAARRAERERSSQFTNTAIIASNTAVITSMN